MKYCFAPGTILVSVCDRHFLVTAETMTDINDTSAFYLRSLENGGTEEELLRTAKERFEGEEEIIRHDIRELLDFFLQSGALQRCEE